MEQQLYGSKGEALGLIIIIALTTQALCFSRRQNEDSMGLKWDAMENMLGNTLGTWATYWEPIENLKGTHWEREKNEKKNPSSS
jgi:hypothetical protein